MGHQPDYETLREETSFRWYVGSSYYAFFGLVDIPIEEVNLKPEAMIELVRRGRPRFREMWGEDVPVPAVTTPAISYGHLNGLGAELIFPEGGEVGFAVLCDSLKQGIDLLKKEVDFKTAGMAPFYLDYRRRLQEAFPGEPVGFSYSVQGPMTTAYGLRGQGIFYDVHDDPERVREFLHRCVDSILQFKYFIADLNEQPRINPGGARLYDDVGSMFSPAMWPEFVLPFMERFFQGLTTGPRSAHVEDLRPEHLPFLEDLGLVDFEPSISPKLSPKIIRDGCRVPFGWRMGSFHYRGLAVQEVEDWVFQAVTDGASYVFTHIAEIMCSDETVEKVHALIRAAKEAERLLAAGATREQIGERVSPAGRKRFWDRWPE